MTLSKNPVLVPRHADDLSLQVCKLHYRHQCEMNGQFQASDQEEETQPPQFSGFHPQQSHQKRGKMGLLFFLKNTALQDTFARGNRISFGLNKCYLASAQLIRIHCSNLLYHNIKLDKKTLTFFIFFKS